MIFILWSFLSKIIPEKGNPSPGNRYFRKKIISQGGYHHREYSGAVFTKTYKYSRSAGQTIFSGTNTGRKQPYAAKYHKRHGLIFPV
jgi:hypothetical protein